MKQYAKRPSRNLKPINLTATWLLAKYTFFKINLFLYCIYLILQGLYMSTFPLTAVYAVERRLYPYSRLSFFGSVFDNWDLDYLLQFIELGCY